MFFFFLFCFCPVWRWCCCGRRATSSRPPTLSSTTVRLSSGCAARSKFWSTAPSSSRCCSTTRTHGSSWGETGAVSVWAHVEPPEKTVGILTWRWRRPPFSGSSFFSNLPPSALSSPVWLPLHTPHPTERFSCVCLCVCEIDFCCWRASQGNSCTDHQSVCNDSLASVMWLTNDSTPGSALYFTLQTFFPSWEKTKQLKCIYLFCQDLSLSYDNPDLLRLGYWWQACVFTGKSSVWHHTGPLELNPPVNVVANRFIYRTQRSANRQAKEKHVCNNAALTLVVFS